MTTAYKLSVHVFGIWSLILIEDFEWRQFLGFVACYYWLGRLHGPEDGDLWERMCARGNL